MKTERQTLLQEMTFVAGTTEHRAHGEEDGRERWETREGFSRALSVEKGRELVEAGMPTMCACPERQFLRCKSTATTSLMPRRLWKPCV